MLCSITHCWCFYLDVYAYTEVPLKLQLKCLILGVYTCFYLVGNWHNEAFQEIEEEEEEELMFMDLLNKIPILL